VAALLIGDGAVDGVTQSAGWVAIVEETFDQPQPAWAEARAARGLIQWQAASSAIAKFFLWHTSQPLAFLGLVFVFRCFIAGLGKAQ
jgi:hypothetical protein